jgi:branched-chain amino acid aminotransferase
MANEGTTRTPEIRIERAAESRWSEAQAAAPAFGRVFGDHMLVAEYHDGAWHDPVIRPYGPLPLPPSISALHYGQAAFEGMKAHRSPAGEVLLFRPRENALRFQRSAERLAMPPVPEDLFLGGLRALLRLDERWVPAIGAGALYIRPVIFSSDPAIGVRAGERYLFVIMTCPFGAYFASPVDVFVTRRFARAFPGGTGDVKPAGNYGPALLAEREARAQGCQSVLWLDAREQRYVEECGVMNVFFVIGDRVVTPALSGTILPGVTRDSVITLLRDAGWTVEERQVGIDELTEAHAAGRLREAFGTGTAATVTHIKRIHCDGKDLVLPPIENRRAGPEARERLTAIMIGAAADPHGWVERS